MPAPRFAGAPHPPGLGRCCAHGGHAGSKRAQACMVHLAPRRAAAAPAHPQVRPAHQAALRPPASFAPYDAGLWHLTGRNGNMQCQRHLTGCQLQRVALILFFCRHPWYVRVFGLGCLRSSSPVLQSRQPELAGQAGGPSAPGGFGHLLACEDIPGHHCPERLPSGEKLALQQCSLPKPKARNLKDPWDCS